MLDRSLCSCRVEGFTFGLPVETFRRRESPSQDPRNTKLAPTRQQQEGFGQSLAFCIFSFDTTPAATSRLNKTISPAARVSSRVEGVSHAPQAASRFTSNPSALGAPLDALEAAPCAHRVSPKAACAQGDKAHKPLTACHSSHLLSSDHGQSTQFFFPCYYILCLTPPSAHTQD